MKTSAKIQKSVILLQKASTKSKEDRGEKKNIFFREQEDRTRNIRRTYVVWKT